MSSYGVTRPQWIDVPVILIILYIAVGQIFTQKATLYVECFTNYKFDN